MRLKHPGFRVNALVLIALLAGMRSSRAQSASFSDWPEGMSPQEVGKAVAEHFVVSPHQNPQRIIYPEVCAWYGALSFAEVTGDKALAAELVARFNPLMTPAESAMVPQRRHVDDEIFGVVPLEDLSANKGLKIPRLWEGLRRQAVGPAAE